MNNLPEDPHLKIDIVLAVILGAMLMVSHLIMAAGIVAAEWVYKKFFPPQMRQKK